VKIAVLEDDHDKFAEIFGALTDIEVHRSNIHRAEDLAQLTDIVRRDIDLCIIDLKMPNLKGGHERNVGREILSMLEYGGKRTCPVLAITAFAEEAEELRDEFASRGCIIFDYQAKSIWKRALEIYVSQARDRGRYDFIIFAALDKERAAFRSDGKLDVKSVVRHGVDHWDCEISGRPGTIVKLPRMGLVNASSVVSKVMTLYAPRVTAMAGICAGIGKDAALGQLLITDVCWEYQSGKWYKDAFLAEPYQVSVSQDTRVILEKILDDDTLLKRLETNFNGKHRPSEVSKPRLALFATGSAVISSEKRLKSIASQHRKVSGIDMEIFGFHQAMEVCGHKGFSFSAKTVVDRADEQKGDELHEYGASISAQFVISTLENIYQRADEDSPV
jgi:adenosylhomocysteine nucleosidase